MSSVIRQLGLGRLAYRYLFRPAGPWRWVIGFGGKGAVRYLLGQMQMRAAARNLQPWDRRSDHPLRTTYLTGHKHWYQTAIAAHSLAVAMDGNVEPTFVDDGSLSQTDISLLQRVFPHSRIVLRRQLAERMAKALPPERYPRLYAARQASVFMRKLMDLRAGLNEWQLYLDSDMLFFRRPEYLERCSADQKACYMAERIDAYVLSSEEIEARCRTPIVRRANGGIIALNDAAIDWGELERWCDALQTTGPMLEQTLTAMLQAQQGGQPTPGTDYYVLYGLDESGPSNPVLLHYIYRAKLRFFAEDWRRIVHSSE